MHYQHRYHAGNFADVFKHVLLCGLLQALNRKDKPWAYLETHAGAGAYDLASEAAQKTGEWRDGIGRLAGFSPEAEPLRSYLQLVAATPGAPQAYPGSPAFALGLARAQDRIILCEKVPAVCEELKIRMGADPRVHVHQRDGYESLGLLPPPEKRGLVLVDPPFERPDEFDAVSEFLRKALGRFGNGVFAVWYPIKNRFEADRFRRRMMREHPRSGADLQLHNGAVAEGEEARFASTARGDSERPAMDGRAGGGRRVEAAPWTAPPPPKYRMTACGLAVINPPFGYAEAMRPVLQGLAKRLAQGPQAEASVESWEQAGKA